MSQIIIFGAGGRAGRTAIAEALSRGHRVTAVVRDPAKHPDLAGTAPQGTPESTAQQARSAADDGAAVRIVAGDVTDAGSVAALAQGHDAAINAAADLAAPADVFFPAAARALLDGLAKAGVNRFISVGLASVLETESGTLLMDSPGYPREYRAFMEGHGAGTEVLRRADTPIDWVVISPSGDFDHGGPRTGRYRTAPADAAGRISYADFAIALIDEIENPRHHRIHIGVTQPQ